MAGNGNFPENRYAISIVEPVRDGIRQGLRVEVYEKLDHFNPGPVYDVKHIRLVGDFPLYDSRKHRDMSLDEVVKKVDEIVEKRK